ncbi:MAG: hypothetical protein CFH41_00239 [Alphaproteobacteria bacterium MarineAlpha11_Bin1]|nr:MAG: hypothetical protein CFH41_00239 [Alphaproteobacteria bacterium MarineAlpha11_Bin1]|tara:strand:+ start:7345 stop:7914 length:570 start_codon:yes stop_codon:yes gene_type:complete
MPLSRPKYPKSEANFEGKICAHPDCSLDGKYRAPQSRDTLDQYYWFCLEHVRDYNSAWNYYADMDDATVEAEMRNDVVWRRPTWPLGSRTTKYGDRISDPLNIFGQGLTYGPLTREAETQLQSFSSEEREAVSVLGLVAPVTKADVKLRYKTLAKMLHPDANGGDKRAEDQLKLVNYAYTTLRDSDRLI